MSFIKKIYKKNENKIFWALLVIFLIVLPLFLLWQSIHVFQQETNNQLVLDITSAEMSQFSNSDGKLLAVGKDPNITFNNIPVQVGSIKVNCSNANPYSESQLFYRNRGGHFMEIFSIRYMPLSGKNMFNIPVALNVNSLRLDLTNVEKDIVTCKEIVINPYSRFPSLISGFFWYLLSAILLFVYLFRFNPVLLPKTNRLRNRLSPYANEFKVQILRTGAELETSLNRLKMYFKENSSLILWLSLITITAYGFELFNINLTIDEEFAVNQPETDLWITEGRWGMYLLEKLILPDPVIPFLPLFISLIFHQIAMMLFIHSWGISNKLMQVIVASIGITFPSLAFIYSFSTINFGIGIGFFVIALSQYIFNTSSETKRYLVILPIIFVIGIYQPLVFPLICAFIIVGINSMLSSRPGAIRSLMQMLIIFIISTLLYLIVQNIFAYLLNLTLSDYFSNKLAFGNLINNFSHELLRYFHVLWLIYSGNPLVYSYPLRVIGLLILIIISSILFQITYKKIGIWPAIVTFVLIACLILLPITYGLVTGGQYDTRHLLGLPIVISGLVMIGWQWGSKLARPVIAVLSLLLIFQSIRVSNNLFGSAYFALQADRSLGTLVIGRIQEIIDVPESYEQVKYLEVVGYHASNPNELSPKIDTLGASFFEWEQGSSDRVIAFLKTLGFSGLNPLPIHLRADVIPIARGMPNWPAQGSVIIYENVVILKFSNYSDTQKNFICYGLVDSGPGNNAHTSCLNTLFKEPEN